MFILPRTTLVARRLLPAIPTTTTTTTTKSSLHTSPISQSTAGDSTPANTLHNTDTYSKDVDTNPVEDTSVHRVDPSSELVQKPHEPPSGAWSRAGVQTEDYRSVQGAGGKPYEPKGSSGTRYGSRMSWADDKARETSGSEEGPEEGSSKGRK